MPPDSSDIRTLNEGRDSYHKGRTWEYCLIKTWNKGGTEKESTVPWPSATGTVQQTEKVKHEK